tara:strand:+ start:310 stop:615 length:306 start_codon:yes stop_codon:yes gene_type:complete
MPRKIQNRKITRDSGSRTNYFSDDIVSSPSDIQRTIDTIADKVDSETGRVEKSDATTSEGSIRAVKGKKNWFLEIKTSDGWIRSAEEIDNVPLFKIKDKNS